MLKIDGCLLNHRLKPSTWRCLHSENFENPILSLKRLSLYLYFCCIFYCIFVLRVLKSVSLFREIKDAGLEGKSVRVGKCVFAWEPLKGFDFGCWNRSRISRLLKRGPQRGCREFEISSKLTLATLESKVWNLKFRESEFKFNRISLCVKRKQLNLNFGSRLVQLTRKERESELELALRLSVNGFRWKAST